MVAIPISSKGEGAEDHPLHRGRTASGPLSRRPGPTRGCCSPKSPGADRFIENIGDLVGGERPLPRTFQRSRWGQNSKLRWQSSTGPPLPSLALQAKKRSRWRHQAAVDQSTSYNFSSSHHSSVSLSQIDQKLLSGRSHLSSFSCALLLRIGQHSGCGWLPSCSSMALTLLNHKIVYIITGVH